MAKPSSDTAALVAAGIVQAFATARATSAKASGSGQTTLDQILNVYKDALVVVANHDIDSPPRDRSVQVD